MNADANSVTLCRLNLGTAFTRSVGQMIAGMMFAGCLATYGPNVAFASESLLGKQAPEFSRTGLDGNQIDLAHEQGKVVLLNFWATWCAPCKIEMPAFAEWQRQYGPQGFKVIGISMDDDAPPVRRLAARLRLNYPVAMGDEALGELYGGVLGLPLTYLIDRNGVIRARFQGKVNIKTIETQVKALLEQR